MDTLMFGSVGLFFILLGLFLNKKHSTFISKSIVVSGRVIGIVDKVHNTHGIFGQITDKRTVKVPIVQYEYSKLYQFQGQIDVRSHNLAKDSTVNVLINPFQPKIAKLSLGAKESTMLFKLMIGLGVFSVVLGAIQFNPNTFNIGFISDPFTLAIIAISSIFLFLKVWPMLSFLFNAPIYTENAVEINKQDNA